MRAAPARSRFGQVGLAPVVRLVRAMCVTGNARARRHEAGAGATFDSGGAGSHIGQPRAVESARAAIGRIRLKGDAKSSARIGGRSRAARRAGRYVAGRRAKRCRRGAAAPALAAVLGPREVGFATVFGMTGAMRETWRAGIRGDEANARETFDSNGAKSNVRKRSAIMSTGAAVFRIVIEIDAAAPTHVRRR
jgi:hypothetical protein